MSAALPVLPAGPTASEAGAEPKRRAGRLVAVAGAAFLGLAVLSSYLPGGGGQGGGSPSSSYSNRPDGTAAWAELLSRFGHHVDRLRGDVDPSALDPAATVVVLDAPALSDREARDLRAFVRAGGHLVAGAAGTSDWLDAVLDRPPVASAKGARTAAPAPALETESVAGVRMAHLGSWREAGELAPVLVGDSGRIVAVAGDVGKGRVVALADPSPLQNGALALDDDAAFGLAVVGGAGRPVVFAEGPHGYGRGEGLAALPRRWRLALAGLGLAAAVWLLARSRRLGPPEDEARPLPPPRWAYVDAVTSTLARTRRSHEAVEPVRRRACELIARRAGLPPDAGPEDLHRAGTRLGLTDEESAAVTGAGPADEAGVLAAGRALARLAGRES